MRLTLVGYLTAVEIFTIDAEYFSIAYEPLLTALATFTAVFVVGLIVSLARKDGASIGMATVDLAVQSEKYSKSQTLTRRFIIRWLLYLLFLSIYWLYLGAELYYTYRNDTKKAWSIPFRNALLPQILLDLFRFESAIFFGY